MKTLIKIDLSSPNGRLKRAQVELEEVEIDLIGQALAYWLSQHPAFLMPQSQAVKHRKCEIHKLHLSFSELQEQLAKGGE